MHPNRILKCGNQFFLLLTPQGLISTHQGLCDFKGISGLDQWAVFREGNTNPWCLLLWAPSSNSNSLLRRSNRQRSLETVIISQLMFSSKVPRTEKQYFYFNFLLLLQLGEISETVGSKVKANIFCQFLFCHCSTLVLLSVSQRWHG